jgi:hypothetical protein
MQLWTTTGASAHAVRPGPQNVLARAPSAYSITSSARARIDGGTVRPSDFAVLRLTTNWKLVACSIGKSPGLAFENLVDEYGRAAELTGEVHSVHASPPAQ